MACTALNTDTIVPIKCINDIVSSCSSTYSISPTATQYRLNNVNYAVNNGNLTTTTVSSPNRVWGDIKTMLNTIATTTQKCNPPQVQSGGGGGMFSPNLNTPAPSATPPAPPAASPVAAAAAAAAVTTTPIPPVNNIGGGDGNLDDLLLKIKNLQTVEQSLISQLDSYTSNSGGFNAADPTIIDLTNKINSIADTRISMLKSISRTANIVQTGVSESRSDLVSQMTLLQAVEDQLNQAKAKIQGHTNRNDTQMRMVEINTYYGQRYEAQGKLMKKIIMVCLPLLILFILKKKGLLPETIGNYLIGIVIAVGALYIIRSIWDIYTRSNMDFNTYNWEYEQPSAQVPSIWEYNKANMFNYDNLLNNLMKNIGVCIGDSCCAPGTVYDSTSFQCVASNSNDTIMSKSAAQAKLDAATEQFISGDGLLQGTVIKSYINDEKKNGTIAPFSYDMQYAAI
jgi:hypothetical protein